VSVVPGTVESEKDGVPIPVEILAANVTLLGKVGDVDVTAEANDEGADEGGGSE